MPSNWDEETKQKIAERQRQAYANGTRKAPSTMLKEENVDLKVENTGLKTEKAELKTENLSLQERLASVEAWRERVQDVARRYRDLLAKGADSKNAELSSMCRELIDALGS